MSLNQQVAWDTRFPVTKMVHVLACHLQRHSGWAVLGGGDCGGRGLMTPSRGPWVLLLLWCTGWVYWVVSSVFPQLLSHWLLSHHFGGWLGKRPSSPLDTEVSKWWLLPAGAPFLPLNTELIHNWSHILVVQKSCLLFIQSCLLKEQKPTQRNSWKMGFIVRSVRAPHRNGKGGSAFLCVCTSLLHSLPPHGLPFTLCCPHRSPSCLPVAPAGSAPGDSLTTSCSTLSRCFCLCVSYCKCLWHSLWPRIC